MKLNIRILADFLETVVIIDKAIYRPFSFTLETPVFFEGNELTDSYLYITTPDLLPAEFPMEGFVSILCIGSLPPNYQLERCEYICVSDETELSFLFNHLFTVFSNFNRWEVRILECLNEHLSMHEIGEILFEILGNPVSFCTPFLKIVMFVDKSNHPKSNHYVENMYIPSDELNVVITDPEYKETLKMKEPSVFSGTMYGYRKLYYNIMHNNELLGRIVIDEIYHPAKESDLSLLLLFSKYVKQSYLHKCLINLGETREFDEMIKKLVIYNNPYREKYDSMLRSYGWKKDDFYCFACLSSSTNVNYHFKLIEDTIYLRQLLENNYIFTNENHIVILLNLNNKGSMMPLHRKFEYVSKNLNYFVGIGNRFDNFEKLNIYYKQSVTALKIGQQIHPDQGVFEYKRYILECVVSNALLDNEKEFFISEQFRCLQIYDHNRGTNLVETLKVCLENNMNAASAQKLLHVHRTTYLYRIRRIQEISGINLDDYRTRLYLMILFEIINI